MASCCTGEATGHSVNYSGKILSLNFSNTNQTVKLLPNISSKREHDTQKLLQIFPEELWLLVLDQINDSSETEAVAKSSICFQKILEPRRVQYLFSQVLPFLTPSFGFASPERDRISEHFQREDEIQRGRSVPKLVWFGTLYQMRLVCRSWQSTIDSYFANHRLHYRMEHDETDIQQDYRENPDNFADHMDNYLFTYMDLIKIDNFLEHFYTNEASITQNPFIGRKVSFEDLQCRSWRNNVAPLNANQVRDHSKQLRNKFTDLLTTYGHHVWHFRIKVCDEFCTKATRTEYLKKVGQWLELMPYLKTLNIEYENVPLTNFISKEQAEARPILEEISVALNNKPFPSLKNLQFLKTNKLPAPLFSHLLATNYHLIRLEAILAHNIHGDNQLAMLPNLQQLSISVLSENDVQWLDYLAPYMRNLIKLRLTYDSPTPCFQYNFWTRYLEILCRHWGQSPVLEDLTMQSANRDHYSGLENFNASVLRLPPVKRLKLIMNVHCQLDFLVQLRDSLETLHLYLKYGSFSRGAYGYWEKKQAERVILLGFEDNMDRSNIWEYLPKLKKIIITECSHKTEFIKYENKFLIRRSGRR